MWGSTNYPRGAFADDIAFYSTITTKVAQILEARRSDMEDRELKMHPISRKRNV